MNLPNLLTATLKKNLSFNVRNNKLLISNKKEKASKLISDFKSASNPYNLIFDTDYNYYHNIHVHPNFSSNPL